MVETLYTHIDVLVTMDAARREIADGALLVRDGVIAWVGKSDDLPEHHADEVISLRGRVVIPGLVNTHHHMFQSLTRVVAQDRELFGWLKSLYPIWQNIGAQHLYTATRLSMAELMMAGCTTASDHTYIFPNGARLDDQIRAAQELGLRFHAARGAMTLGESAGGLPPDSLVEDEAFVLKDTMRAIEAYHDARRGAMLRVVVAPCAPFNVSQDLMRESARLARSYGVRLHTHLAENANDIAYSLEVYGQRPGDYAESIGWLGDDVWHAHCVQLDGDEIRLFARTGTGVCHCPSSNMRLASGIAPVRAMLDAGVKVGLGVDGSASNDSGHLLNEARTAMLLQRVAHTDPSAMTAREALEVATLGGAKVLGRDDIGALAVGMCADFAAYRTDALAFAGAGADPVAALVFCQSVNADMVVVHGRQVIRDGAFVALDVPTLVEAHNKLSLALLRGEG
jgi:cytosine/adenosine deaminase-related metal-dependent hydrolase